MSNTIIGEKVLNDAHLKQQLQILRQADNWTNLYYISMIYIYLASVICSTLFFYYQRETWGLPFWVNIPVSILAIILIGAGQHQLTGLGHEGSHHSLFKTKKWN
jgi:fatty acid desaturase